MARRGKRGGHNRAFDPLNPKFGAERQKFDYYIHYYDYLRSLVYQLIEWEGLPNTVDPRYFEKVLHENGYIGFYKDPDFNFLAVEGAVSGRLDNYHNPLQFHANTPTYQKTFNLYHYQGDETRTKMTANGDFISVPRKKLGLVCYNNDIHKSSLPVVDLFAQDLAELKQIIRINQNAQKTPVAIKANQNNRLSMQVLFNQVDGNAPVIITDESYDIEGLKAIDLRAPVVFPQLNDQKNNVWNEFMTWLGIDNTNLQKKERMVTAEVDGNQDQVQNSANIFLKSRLEFAKRANELYGLHLKPKLRVEVVKEIQQNAKENVSRETIEKGGGEHGEVHGADS